MTKYFINNVKAAIIHPSGEDGEYIASLFDKVRGGRPYEVKPHVAVKQSRMSLKSFVKFYQFKPMLGAKLTLLGTK